ncbi:hypothetical protein ACYRFS_12985 [Listeria kieliensis]
MMFLKDFVPSGNATQQFKQALQEELYAAFGAEEVETYLDKEENGLDEYMKHLQYSLCNDTEWIQAGYQIPDENNPEDPIRVLKVFKLEDFIPEKTVFIACGQDISISEMEE